MGTYPDIIMTITTNTEHQYFEDEAKSGFYILSSD